MPGYLRARHEAWEQIRADIQLLYDLLRPVVMDEVVQQRRRRVGWLAADLSGHLPPQPVLWLHCPASGPVLSRFLGLDPQQGRARDSCGGRVRQQSAQTWAQSPIQLKLGNRAAVGPHDGGP